MIDTSINTPGIIDTSKLPARKAPTRDFIPGVNVGELLKAITGQKSFDEANILDNVSFTGGVREPVNPVLGFGATATTSKSPSGSPTGKEITSNAIDDGIDTSGISDIYSSSSASDTSDYDLASALDQIDSLNRLLGYYGTQKQAGLENIQSSASKAKSDAARAFEEQRLSNQKARVAGLDEVGQFANKSYENLNRLLQGAKAGRSSVAQELVPYLISKGASARRTGVVNTAGENAQAIQKAQNESDYSLEEQRKQNESDFLRSILEKENEMLSSKQQLETQANMIKGGSYAQAKALGTPTQIAIDDRMNQLKNLFSAYKPSYTVAKAPDLSTYTMDKSTISQSGEATPTSSSLYYQQLKKKLEENQA